MDVLFGLVLGVAALGYIVWAVVSPFVVIGFGTRITELERQLNLLRRQLKENLSKASPPAPATDAIPPVVTSTAVEPPSVAGYEVEPKPAPTRVTPPSLRVPQYIERRDTWKEPVEQATPSVPPAPLVHPSIPVPVDGVEPADVYQVAKPHADELSATPFPAPSPEPVRLPPRTPVTSPAPHKTLTATSEDEPSTLEEILAGKWLTWVGALAVIIGAGFGFKYAIENNYIGPKERVMIGIVTGLACFAGGAYAMSRKYRFLAQGLTGAGLGVLYLSLYASYGMYGLLSYEMAFLGMILTTTLGLSFAGYFNVQPTAVLGMVGGFLTPAMLWPDHDPMWLLFPYLLMLDLGVLLVAGIRRWAGLEILTFCGTMLVWFNWHQHYYDVQKLNATVGYLTATFVLFALLSVWHNVIRRRTATAGDFFLILTTPVAYFATLYGLTFEHWPEWQSEFALLMMAFYAGMAALAAFWHPAGKSIIAALAGMAATFLILAPPLELTGHWVTICWIAQAVLLVELGLYFYERALLWTGLGLLAKVQVILLIYFFGTFADPVHFQTAFVRLQLHLIGRPETPFDTAQGWWSLINGRSLSYLVDVIGFALLAWELGRRKHDERLRGLWPNTTVWQTWINIAAPLMGLTMIILETYVWGIIWHWDPATIVSAWTIWTAVFACGCILWSQALRAPGMEGLGWLLYAVLCSFVFFTSQDALRYSMFGDRIPEHRLLAPWLIHPRGISLLCVITVSCLISWFYKVLPARETRLEDGDRATTSGELARWFGICAYSLALGMVLLETRVWSVHHDWLVATTLTVCVAWTATFLVSAISWRVLRRDDWLDGIIYPTLMLLELFLVCSALNTLATLQSPGVTGYLGSDMARLTVGEWWFFNQRAYAFAIATLACLLGVTICRRLPCETPRVATSEPSLASVLAVAAFLNSFAMVWLETYAWGQVWGWEFTTIVSVWTIWTAPFACGAIYWSETIGSRRIEQLGWTLWIVLACLIGFNTLDALVAAQPHAIVSQHRLNAYWLLNPRGVSFLTVILAGIGVSCIYGLLPRRNAEGDWAAPNLSSESLSRLFAGGTFFLTLGTILLETWVWGFHHEWLSVTRHSASAGWTGLFLLAAALWRVEREARWVERLVTATFGILGAFILVESLKVFLPLPAETTLATAAEWWLLNARGLGYVAAVLACGLSAWHYRRLPDAALIAGRSVQGTQLGIAAYVIGLWMVLLETTAWGYPHGWLIGTLVAGHTIWISIFLVGLVAWSVRQRTSNFDPLVVLMFVGLLLTLIGSGSGALINVNGQQPETQRAFREVVENWCWNPRFIGFLVSIIATSMCARLYQGTDHKWKIADATAGGSREKSLNLSNEFAIAAYLAGVAMFTLEAYVQGTSRDWQTKTSLAITLVWTTYATLTLIGGIYWKAGWLRAFSLGLLVITVGKVFLVDVWHLDTVIRVFAFISLGVALLLVSFLYRRYRERIRSWIVPTSRPAELDVVQPGAE